MIKEYLEKKASFLGYTAGGTALGAGAGALHAYLKNKKIHPEDPDGAQKKKVNYVNSVSRGAGIGAAAGIAGGMVIPKLHERGLNKKIDKNTDKYIGKKLDAREATRSNMKWFARPFVKSKGSVIRGAKKDLKNLKASNKTHFFEGYKSLKNKSKTVNNTIR